MDISNPSPAQIKAARYAVKKCDELNKAIQKAIALDMTVSFTDCDDSMTISIERSFSVGSGGRSIHQIVATNDYDEEDD